MTQTLILSERGEASSPQLRPALEGMPVSSVPTAGGTVSVAMSMLGSGFDNTGYGLSYFAPYGTLVTQAGSNGLSTFPAEGDWAAAIDSSALRVINLGADRLARDMDLYVSQVSDRSVNFEAFVTDQFSEQVLVHGFADLWKSRLNITPTVERMERYRRARRVEQDSRSAALQEVKREIAAETSRFALLAPRELVLDLTRREGAGQMLIARAVGVTPTAIRKWRRGEPARPEHRARLASFAALISILNATPTHNPVSWLEIPIVNDSFLTPLDLAVGGRSDLVVLHARGLLSPYETLDEFEPSWRTQFASDQDYTVVTLADGSRAVVPR